MKKKLSKQKQVKPIRAGLSKGFTHMEKAINPKRLKYLASCDSCSYNKGEGFNCTNSNVTQFDMVKDEETQREFCGYWKL